MAESNGNGTRRWTAILSTVFLGLMATIMTAGVGWAFVVQGDLGTIKESLQTVAKVSNDNNSRIRDIEIDMARAGIGSVPRP